MKSPHEKALGGKKDGFDGHKRWGNSAVKGHGVNSPAMMAARKSFSKKGHKKSGFRDSMMDSIEHHKMESDRLGIR